MSADTGHGRIFKVEGSTRRRPCKCVLVTAEAVVDRMGQRNIGEVAIRDIPEATVAQELILQNPIAKRWEIARHDRAIQFVVGRRRIESDYASLAVSRHARRGKVHIVI